MKDDKRKAQERNNIKFHDMSSILNFGLGSQNGVADLNRVTTKIIKSREYDELMEMFKELSSLQAMKERSCCRRGKSEWMRWRRS